MALSPQVRAGVEPAEARALPQDLDEPGRLAALLVALTPFAVAAWASIGFVVFRLLT